MYFAGSYVDPIYIVIFTLVAVFLILAGIIVILYRYLQVLKGIQLATQQTSQNTEPIKRLPKSFLLMEVSTPTVSADLPSDVTQVIPDGLRAIAEEKYKSYSGQLFANSASPPLDEP